jgi:hypothetical protein
MKKLNENILKKKNRNNKRSLTKTENNERGGEFWMYV